MRVRLPNGRVLPDNLDSQLDHGRAASAIGAALDLLREVDRTQR